jgi:hypothetical protein
LRNQVYLNLYNLSQNLDVGWVERSATYQDIILLGSAAARLHPTYTSWVLDIFRLRPDSGPIAKYQNEYTGHVSRRCWI